jgi:alanyl aminopeptidase
MSPDRVVLTAIAWLVLACAGSPDTEIAAPQGRLPESIRPLHYALDLEIIPERRSFSGEVTITVALDDSTRTIWLHGEDLEVSEVTVEQSGRKSRDASWSPAEFTGVVAIRVDDPLEPGRAVLRIRYRADFSEDLEGLYRVEAGDAAYAVTQFEAISARRAFPSFDEPTFKTPFDVTLTVPSAHVAVANTLVVSEEILSDGNRRIRFATTAPLPTYLLAWLVGPFDVREGALIATDSRERPLPFRALAAAGRGDELAYTLKNTPPLLEALEQYTGSAYPFDKLDVIAVPDFGSGAMENVGAITFRDSLLLMDPETAPEWQLRSFAYVMAHELAHTWFGNLVTMPWWNDLWLNESFATWAGHRAVAEVHPEYNFDVALLERVHSAMNSDRLASARMIRQPIESEHDIANAFDSITYSKGAGVLSMFERWLGKETFRAGIRRYLSDHAFGSGDANDLTAALGAASDRDVAGPFDSFLTQPGVPFLRTDLICDSQGSRLTVEQSRYRPVGSSASSEQLWQVPVCVRYGVGNEVRERCEVIAEARAEIELDACPSWVLPNAGGAGYYRFAGSPQDGDNLITKGWPALTASERLAVADSMIASFYAGALGPEAVLPAMERFVRDTHRAVAQAPMSLLSDIINNIAPSGAQPGARRFASTLYAPLLAELGFDAPEGDDGERRLLRSAVVRHLAYEARDPDVRSELATRGRAYAGVDGSPNSAAVDADLASTALAVAVRDSGPEVFDTLLERLESTQDSVERGRFLNALASSQDPERAERARDLSLDSSLRVNERLSVLRVQMAYPDLRDAAWRWVEENHRALIEQIDPSSQVELTSLASNFCDTARADEIEDFFTPFIAELEGGPRSLASATEQIRLCAALKRAQAPAIAQKFGAH